MSTENHTSLVLPEERALQRMLGLILLYNGKVETNGLVEEVARKYNLDRERVENTLETLKSTGLVTEEKILKVSVQPWQDAGEVLKSKLVAFEQRLAQAEEVSGDLALALMVFLKSSDLGDEEEEFREEIGDIIGDLEDLRMRVEDTMEKFREILDDLDNDNDDNDNTEKETGQ